MKSVSKLLLLATAAAVSGTAAMAAPMAAPSVFAMGPAGASGPDSITTGAGSVWVSYAGGTTADGSEPSGSSTVVRYDPQGNAQATFSIKGSVDGLKYNPTNGTVWALQNQDANSRLTIINPADNSLVPFSYANASAHQGYDDVVFRGNDTFLSFTNPAAPTDTTVQKVVAGTNPIAVTSILTAGTPGTNMTTGATDYVPPVADPDSLKLAPNGDLVQTSGNRDTLVFVHNPGDAGQTVSYLPLTDPARGSVTGLDDSLFLTSASGTLYLTETGNNTVLQVRLSDLTPGSLLANVGSLQELALVDTTTGVLTPFLTGLSSPHGLAFNADATTAVPEPASLALIGAGLLGMAGFRRRGA